MSVRVGFQSISAGSFINRRGALGVMTGQYALLEYQTAGFFSPSTKGFCLNSAYGLPNRDLLWILRQGAAAFARSAQGSSRMRSRKDEIHGSKLKGLITIQAMDSKVLIYCRRSNIPNTI
jgi:hypothetical protein